MDSSFAYPTRQAASLLGVEAHCLRDGVRRKGHYKGITPRKVGRNLLWPRSETLAAAGVPEVEPLVRVSVLAVGSFLDEHVGYLKDPVLDAVALALVDPRPRLQTTPDLHLHDSHALRDICTAHVRRLERDSRLTPAQRHDALLGLARAVLPVLDAVPADLLQQALRETIGAFISEGA